MKVQAIANLVNIGAAAPAGGAGQVARAVVAPMRAEVKAAVEAINKAIQPLVGTLEFSVDDSTKMNVVKVVDTNTKEVLRQFPSQEALDIAQALHKLQGILLKARA